MKASRLNGIAVVSIADATKEGTVRDTVLDPNRRRVVALSIQPTGGGPQKTVSVKDVHSVRRDAVTIRDRDVLRQEHPIRGDSEVMQSKLKGKRVLTERGKVIGNVAEVEIDPESFSIIGYELSTGFMSDLTGNREKLSADDNVHFGRDVFIVSEPGSARQPSEGRETRTGEKSHSQR